MKCPRCGVTHDLKCYCAECLRFICKPGVFLRSHTVRPFASEEGR